MVLATSAAAPIDRATLLGNLHVLPDDILKICLSFLSHANLAVTSLVCRKLQALSNEEPLWRFLYQKDFPLQPGGQPHKLHYQICYNINKERYAVMGSTRPPDIILFESNQTLRFYPETTESIGFFYQGNCIGLDLPLQADVDNLYMEWNGNRLAIACVDEEVPSVRIFGITENNLVEHQILPLQTVGFVWIREQLVTATVSESHVVIQIWNPDAAGHLQLMYSCDAPGSEDVVEYLDSIQENREAYDDSNFYESLAWDGEWLALPHKDGNHNHGVHVWKVSEGQLIKEVFLEQQASCDCLRWKGNLLFIEDGKKIRIWDRVSRAYCKEIDCSGLSHNDGYSANIQFRGNQLFVGHGNTISLWEADEHGTYAFVYNIFHGFDCNVLNFHRSGLYVRVGSTRGPLVRVDFRASHRTILGSLHAELRSLIQWDDPDKNKGLNIVYQRLLKLPPSVKDPILQSLKTIAVSNSNKRKHEDIAALPVDPLLLIEAIGSYLERTKKE